MHKFTISNSPIQSINSSFKNINSSVIAEVNSNSEYPFKTLTMKTMLNQHPNTFSFLIWHGAKVYNPFLQLPTITNIVSNETHVVHVLQRRPPICCQAHSLIFFTQISLQINSLFLKQLQNISSSRNSRRNDKLRLHSLAKLSKPLPLHCLK